MSAPRRARNNDAAEPLPQRRQPVGLQSGSFQWSGRPIS